jgi:hypothetical protein
MNSGSSVCGGVRLAGRQAFDVDGSSVCSACCPADGELQGQQLEQVAQPLAGDGSNWCEAMMQACSVCVNGAC